MKSYRSFLFAIASFIALLAISLMGQESVAAKPPAQVTSPSQLIDAVNNLRVAYGLAPLPVHPILMQSAQSQADYMAATGNITHARPNGTYTQQLLALGFPLAGDLNAGGFRSENILSTYGPLVWDGVPPGWQDAEHMNTMLSGNFTHIGAGISQSGETYYYAVDTAAATSNGQPQSNVPGMLTSQPAGSSSGVSEFMVPVTLSTAAPDGRVVHKVQYGQSLWSIAIAYETTIENIQALNNLGENSTVYQGQELLVLTGVTPAATALPEQTATLPAPPTVVPPTQTSLPAMPTAAGTESTAAAESEAQGTSSNGNGSSRILVIVLIVAAFVGAGMAVWLIRDPGN